MNSPLAAHIPAGQLEKLDGVQTTQTESEKAASTAAASMTERITDAYEVAREYAKQLKDPEYQKNVLDKLVRSNVRGSMVVGVRTPEDVVGMLASVKNWKTVQANLKDTDIIVLQGELPDSYSAFAAYASIREIGHKFGSPGLGSVQAKQGYQQEDDYYFCTMLRFPTNIITVQLKEQDGQEHLHQFFAGPEVTSRGHFNDGDTLVRCGVVIPLLPEQQQKKGFRNDNRQDRRPHRAN